MQNFYRWSDPEWYISRRQGPCESCGKAADGGVPEMRAAASTLKRHAKGVLAGYRHGKTNAAAEGANSTIKVPRRKSHGFGRFDRMRRRLLMALGSCRPERTRALLRDAKRAEWAAAAEGARRPQAMPRSRAGRERRLCP